MFEVSLFLNIVFIPFVIYYSWKPAKFKDCVVIDNKRYFIENIHNVFVNDDYTTLDFNTSKDLEKALVVLHEYKLVVCKEFSLQFLSNDVIILYEKGCVTNRIVSYSDN